MPECCEQALHAAVCSLRQAAEALADAGRPAEALLLAMMGTMANDVLEGRTGKKEHR